MLRYYTLNKRMYIRVYHVLLNINYTIVYFILLQLYDVIRELFYQELIRTSNITAAIFF